MANAEHVKALELQPKEFALWRQKLGFDVDLDFSDADLTGKALANRLLFGANFERAVLNGCDFTNCLLARANFCEARLSRAVFNNANLILAEFQDAILDDASFSEANLTGADLERSSIKGARFTNAILNRVTLPISCSEAEFVGATAEYRGFEGGPIRYWFHITKYVPFAFLASVLAQRLGSWRQMWAVICSLWAIRRGGPLRAIAFVSWPIVGKYGRLQILTRASYLLVVVVPALAFLWPAVLRITMDHNLAIERSIARLVGVTEDAKRDGLQDLAARTKTMAAELDQHKIPPSKFPWTLAALYFAAIFVVIGHLLYELFADEIIKSGSKAKLIRTAGSTTSDQMRILRMGDALREVQLAAAAEPDTYHDRLVPSGGTLLCMPEQSPGFDGLPSHYGLAVIEAAAAIRYDRAAKEAAWAAGLSFGAYLLATGLILAVITYQARTVWQVTEPMARFF